MSNVSVFVAAERDNAAIKRWDGERLVLHGGTSLRLHGHRCLACGGTEEVEARARSFVRSTSSRLLAGLFLMFVASKFVGPFGYLLGVGVALSANHRTRVKLPLCGGCTLAGLVVKALGWGLGLLAFVVCPLGGLALGNWLDGPHSVGMTLVGLPAGLVVCWCLMALWQSLLVPRVAVTCVRIDDDSVTLRVPCRSAVDDMVARLERR